jgi:hypothetical protein
VKFEGRINFLLHLLQSTLVVITVVSNMGSTVDRLCGLVVRVLSYRSKDPVFDSRP